MLHEKLHQPSHQSVKQSVCPSVSQSTCRVTDTEEGKHSLSAASLGLALALQHLNCVSDEREEQELRVTGYGCGCQAKNAFGLSKMQFAGK